jgi:DNA-binding NarL/FixJ family response regulator
LEHTHGKSLIEKGHFSRIFVNLFTEISMHMISVGLVDDHSITRHGIRKILELHNDIKVILEASHGLDLLDQLDKARSVPDIIIMDINMPVMNGFKAVQQLQLKFPKIKIIILSLITEEDTIINMINSGVCGYIPKSADPAIFANAVIAVFKNGFYLGKLVKKEYFSNSQTALKREGFTGKKFLSPKELHFMRLAATNLSYPEIAIEMKVKPKTVENYRDSLFHKLDIKNRAALALYGYKHGLLDFFE